MIDFIVLHCDQLGVNVLCHHFPISSSTYYRQKAQWNNPDLCANRVKLDCFFSTEIERIWKNNRSVYGVRKVWH